MSDASRHSRKKSASGPKPVPGPPPRGGLPLVPPDAGEQRIAYNGDLLSYQALPVVALGGSEGALHSLKEFFAHTPAATGCAYVVVLHAAPAHAVLLPGLIQAHTAMRVAAAADGEELRPDTVYVIPAARHLTVTGHRLRLSALPEGHTGRVAVDLFFRSLADSYGPHATAVVLSGADSDGTIGIKRIKERGGLTIAQDPGEAEFSAMPDSAIATGMVDWVLPARIMPARIRTYRERAAKVRLPPEEGPPSGESPGSAGGRPEAQLTEVLDFLRHRTGHDFSCYKRATILRRLSRRMQISGTESLKDYLHCLRAYPGEAGALAQDLLISVTNFFRDRAAFDLVESRIPELFRDKKPEDTVRIWCPACATGEEPYSMAMLLLEHARGLDAPPSLQVFGCDPNQEAIQTARAGLYPETVTADISRERLQAFFTREAGGYRVNREVREMVMFATHDLLRDAPFSRMDLISCRNLLIYLSREAQARALEIFNFALRPGGLLFLGSSESAEEGGGLFTPLDKTHRLYRQCPAQRAGLPLPTGLSEDTIQRMLSGHERLRGQPPAPPPPPSGRPVLSWPEGAAAPAHSGGKRTSDESQEALDLHFRLLSRFGPPSVVVNADHDVLHLSENMHPFLRMPKGVPTRSLLRLIHPALRLRLRAGLMRAAETGEPAETGPLSLDLPGGPAAVRVRILPAGGGGDPGCLLILFEVQESAAPGPVHPSHAPEPVEPEEVVRQLEREVVRLHADLRSTVEQYESTTGELMASNEEFQAVNEELRSMGEELETSRAELQSINLKLSAVNAEFRLRAAELAQANSDLLNLMNATQIATVFLDRGMRLTRHTPAAAPLFNLTAASIGHPVPHSGHRLDYPEMEADAAQVLDTLVPVEREIRCGDRWLLVRVLPYRTMEDSIAGTVLSFVDFTARRNAEEALRASEEKYHTLFDSMDEGYCIVRMIYDGDGKAVDWRFLEVNRAFERNNGLHSAEGRTIRELVPGIEAKWMEILDRVARTGEPRRLEEESPAMGRVFSLYAFRIGGAHERRVAIIFTDVTGRKRAETGLRRSEEMFSSLVGNAPFGIYLVDSHFRLRTANAVTRGVFQGIDPLLGRDFGEIVRILWREPFASAVIARFDHTLKTGEPWISPPMMEPRANVDENQSYDWQIHRVTLPDGTWGVVCYFYELSELRKPQPAGKPPGNPRGNTL